MIPSRSGGDGGAGVGATAFGGDASVYEVVAEAAKAVMGERFARCEVAIKRVVKV